MIVATLTSRNGRVLSGGSQVCKITDISLDFSRDAIDDTCVGADSRTFVKGLFGATGSATYIVDATEAAANALLNEIFDPVAESDIELQLDSANTGAQAFSFAAIITNVSPAVRVGDKTVATFSFQVTGDVTGRF